MAMRLFLVVGPPGVGKSTICDALASTSPENVMHLQFGDYIERHLGRSAGSRSEMRKNAGVLISPTVIRAAATMLAADLRVLSETDACIVLESRDVARRHYGFRGSSTVVKVLAEFSCEAVLGFYAGSLTISERAGGASSGRGAQALDEINEHSHLQRAYAVAAALAWDCPLYWLNADREVGVIIQDIHSIMAETLASK